MDQQKIHRTTSTNKDFAFLIAQLDKELSNNYKSEQKNYDKYNKVESIETVLLVYHNEKPVGCGCFKPFDNESVEVKRMFVDAAFRGRGISKTILKELESWTTELDYSRLVLETGKKQTEAIGLYESFGFERINNYGQYVDMPNSICFEKTLNESY